MVTREAFIAIVTELRSNTDFFDPVMLAEFTMETPTGETIRPTTYKQVEEDFYFDIEDSTGVKVSVDEMFDVIQFLETYSDVDLYAPSKGVPMDNLLHDWWMMYKDWQRPVEEPKPCPVPTCIVEGLNGEGELEAHLLNEHSPDERVAAGRSLVIDEIGREVEEGEAPIYTRNDLVRLLSWYNERTGDGDYLMADADENERAVFDFIKTIGKE